MPVHSRPNPRPTKGRPREFDLDRALDSAMRVFWRHGYEGASLHALTKAMGINRPSLYAAFGDKAALFRKTLDRYEQGPASYVDEALLQPTARGVAEHLLRGALLLHTHSQNPGGCLMVQGALARGAEAQPVRDELEARRSQMEDSLRRRFHRAKVEGDLPSAINAADLARYIATVVQGMAVQAVGGATRRQLQSVVEIALRAWPSE